MKYRLRTSAENKFFIIPEYIGFKIESTVRLLWSKLITSAQISY